jgi:hypothetical protein
MIIVRMMNILEDGISGSNGYLTILSGLSYSASRYTISKLSRANVPAKSFRDAPSDVVSRRSIQVKVSPGSLETVAMASSSICHPGLDEV